MRIRYLGHSAFSIEYGGKQLILDPFIRDNELAQGINIDTLEADYILLTHGHGDHVADAAYIAEKTGARIISNFEIVSWYETKGISGHPMNHGGSFSFEFGSVKMVNAVHSSVLPDGTPGGNPAGFILTGEEPTLYISGDTAVHYDMKLIPELGYTPNVCIFPIGSNFTMDIEEACLAAEFVKCGTIIGCHYDTFGYIKIDKQNAKDTFAEKGLKLLLPEIGETIHF